jgi:NADPH2:quinone reductase
VRAMVTPQFGGPDLFEERDVERPRPGAGEVLVRVVAAGTNPVDAKLRANGSSAGLEAPIILGADISGVVEEVGPGVTDLAPGDEVYYTLEVFGPRSNGSYAEYHVAKADIVAKKPASLSHEEAAAVPLAGGTAYEAISEETHRTGWGNDPDPRWGWRSRVIRRPDRQSSRCPYPRHGECRQPGHLERTWR